MRMTILLSTLPQRTASKRFPMLLLLTTGCFYAFAETLHAQVVFDWAIVGDTGNHPDKLYNQTSTINPNNLRFGAVDYTYRISKYEVTNDQYVAFLNAVDPAGTNPNGVYSNFMGTAPRGGIAFNNGAAAGAKYSPKSNLGNKPVNYVSFFDAMRFVNWLENGQPIGGSGTEGGVYIIGNGVNETRAAGARFFIPNEDEWYKAAYYQPLSLGGDTDDYWSYPTASNVVPSIATANVNGSILNAGINIANYSEGADWNGQNGNVTTVGSAGAASASFYGTFDQGGNVSEWNEAVIIAQGTSNRGLRGGSWGNVAGLLHAGVRTGDNPPDEFSDYGFRVAAAAEVPEPQSLTLVALAAALCRQRLRRRRSHEKANVRVPVRTNCVC